MSCKCGGSRSCHHNMRATGFTPGHHLRANTAFKKPASWCIHIHLLLTSLAICKSWKNPGGSYWPRTSRRLRGSVLEMLHFFQENTSASPLQSNIATYMLPLLYTTRPASTISELCSLQWHLERLIERRLYAMQTPKLVSSWKVLGISSSSSWSL